MSGEQGRGVIQEHFLFLCIDIMLQCSEVNVYYVSHNKYY